MDVPKGVIGLVGDSGAGVSELIRGHRGAIVYDYSLDSADAFGKLSAETDIEQHRRAGETVLLASHDLDLIRRTADEVWFVNSGTVVKKGDPAEILPLYARHVGERFRREFPVGQIAPSLRRGDGRAEVIDLVTMDEAGQPSAVWRSGKQGAILVRVRFRQPVSDPVVGIMLRTRIGLEVYGTNTELEKIVVGPCAAGDVRTVVFTFLCNLCPQYYTITAASHDPDGVWHDWMEDAIAVTVTDTRYTAGVANLQAQVTCYRE